MSHFRAQIIQKATAHLSAANQSDQSLTETLLAIMILENATAKQALDRLLSARKASVLQSLLDYERSSSSSLSSHLCKIVSMMTVTIAQVCNIFLAEQHILSEGDQNSSLDLYIKFMTQKPETVGSPNSISSLYSEKTNIHVLFRYLPVSIQVCSRS